MNNNEKRSLRGLHAKRVCKRGIIAVFASLVIALSCAMGMFITAYANPSSDHNHSWTYSVNEAKDTITAVCTGEGECDYEGNDKVLKITAQDVTYDGKTHGAELIGSSIVGQWKLDAIYYEGIGSTSYSRNYKAPSKTGTYKATFSIETATAEVTFEIKPIEVEVPSANTDLKYTGSKIKGVINQSSSIYTLEDNEKVDAGKYTAVAKLKNTVNYVWKLSDQNTTTEDQNIDWEIEKACVDVPKANSSLAYDGSMQTGVTVPQYSKYSVTNYKNKDAGTYTAVASLKDKKNYEWKDKSTSDDQNIVWTISKALIELPSSNGTFTYDGTRKTGVTVPKYAKYTVTDYEGYNAGTYTAVASLKDKKNYEWKDKSTSDDQSIVWTISKASVDLPSANGPFDYDASNKIGVTVPQYAKYTVSNNEGYQAGKYTAVASLKDKNNYEWADIATSENQDICWEIRKIAPTANKFSVSIPEEIIFDGDVKFIDVCTHSYVVGMGELTISYRQTGQIVSEPINAGNYEILVSATEGDNFTSISNLKVGEMTIQERPVVVTADDKEMELGKDVPDFTATVKGLIGEEKINYSFNKLNPTSQGVYNIVVTGEEIQGNYSVSYVPGYLYVTKAPESGMSVKQDDLNAILEKYKADVRYKDKDLVLEIRTDGKISDEDKARIQEAAGPDKTIVYISIDLILVVSDSESVVEENIGDENDHLIEIVYDFDYTKKTNIQVFRAHEDAEGVTTIDEITETPNENGERVVYDVEAGKVIVYAMKYSTYSISFDLLEDPVDPNISKTGDNALTSLCIPFICVALIAGASVLALKRKITK